MKEFVPWLSYQKMKEQALKNGKSEEEWIEEQEEWIKNFWNNLSEIERRKIAFFLVRLREILDYKSKKHIDYDGIDLSNIHNQFIISNLLWVMDRITKDIKPTKWERNKMLELRKQNYTIRQIASIFNRSKRIVHKIIKSDKP